MSCRLAGPIFVGGHLLRLVGLVVNFAMALVLLPAFLADRKRVVPRIGDWLGRSVAPTFIPEQYRDDILGNYFEAISTLKEQRTPPDALFVWQVLKIAQIAYVVSRIRFADFVAPSRSRTP